MQQTPTPPSQEIKFTTEGSEFRLTMEKKIQEFFQYMTAPTMNHQLLAELIEIEFHQDYPMKYLPMNAANAQELEKFNTIFNNAFAGYINGYFNALRKLDSTQYVMRLILENEQNKKGKHEQ